MSWGNWRGVELTFRVLRRTQAGAFLLEQAITVDQLKCASPAELEALLPHPRTLLPEMPSVTVDDQVGRASAQWDAGESA